MPESPLVRDVGKHDAQIESLQSEVKALRSDVAEIKSMLDKTRGGWQALSLAAGIAGAIGAAVMKVIFMGNPTPHP